jgi:hypothetical protein
LEAAATMSKYARRGSAKTKRLKAKFGLPDHVVKPTGAASQLMFGIVPSLI